MANYSELLNDINAAIYENNDQEIDALEVRAILREMVTSLGSGFLFKGIATPSSPSGTGTYEPDQNVFYLATTAGTYTYLGGLVVAAGEVAFLCYDGTWTKKSSALLSTGSIVDNLTTDDATKPLSAKQGKVLADAGAATAAEVSALGQKVSVYFPGWEIGNIYISTSGWTYTDSTTRVRLAQGQSLHLFPGDLVGLTDYTSAEYYIGWKRANGTYGTMARWLSGDMTIGEEGDYVFIFRAKPEATVAQASDLAGLFFIKSFRERVDGDEESIKDVAATGCGILAAQANTNGSTSMYLPLSLSSGKTYYLYFSEQNGVGYSVDNIETLAGSVVKDQILLTAGKITAKPLIIKYTPGANITQLKFYPIPAATQDIMVKAYEYKTGDDWKTDMAVEENARVLLEKQFNALPISKGTKSQTDYGFLYQYVLWSDGSLATSGNCQAFQIKNDGFYKITAYLGWGDNSAAAIAFYSGAPAAGTFMQSASVRSVAGANNYECDVPAGCKYIIICNRLSNLASPTFTLYQVDAEMVTPETFLEMANEANELPISFDLAWEPGFLNNSGLPTGNYTDPTAYHRTDFVEVQEGATYRTNVNLAADSLFICFYDKSHNLLYKLTRGETYTTFVVRGGIGVRYCRLVTYSASMTSAEVKKTFYLEGVPGADLQLASKSFVEDSINGTGIFALNPDREVRPKILNALKPMHGNTNTLLCLLHFSDIHADAENLARIVAFRKYYQEYIADTLNTGDMVGNSSEDGFAWWAENDADFVLNVIGNHDSATYSGGVYDWDGFGKVNCYNTYIAPFVAGWGVTQPASAAANGYNYYYKDYSTQGIRLIVLDDMYWDATQESWLVSALADARTNGLSVIVAKHYAPSTWTPTEGCTFDNLTQLSGYDRLAHGIDKVADFITAGGKFICWLCGHLHMDYFGYSTTNPDQLIVGIDTSRGQDNYALDGARKAGTKTQDAFNLFFVDKVAGYVKIVRIGQEWDNTLRHKGTLCFDYINKEIVFNF